MHASVKSSKHKVVSEKFYELLAEFIKLLKALESGDYRKLSSVEHACQSFLLCAEDEVSDKVS